MCITCWQEYGSPEIDNENTRALLPLLHALYLYHSAGGWCHIVTDDFNCEDHSVQYCIDNHWHEMSKEETDCALQLQKCTEDERVSAIAKFWKIW